MRFIEGLSAIVMVLSIGMTMLYGYRVLRYGILGVMLVVGLIKRKAVICRIKSKLQ